MTRKKKPPPQSKRHAVTDNSGWTQITKGPKSTNDTQHTKRLLQQEKIRRESLSLEAYSDRFEKYYTPKWRESSCFRNLESILEQDVLSANNTVTITRCVCLGLGSPTAGVEVSSWELAALISILEILGITANLKISSFATADHPSTGTKHQVKEAIFQDPVFNAIDHAFLKDRDYTIVEDPSAFSMIDDTTFLFAPHLEWVHLATALEGANPSLCVCGDIDGFIRDE